MVHMERERESKLYNENNMFLKHKTYAMEIGANVGRDTSEKKIQNGDVPAWLCQVAAMHRGIFCVPGPPAGEEQRLPSPAAGEGAPLAL